MIDWPKVQEAAEDVIESLNDSTPGKGYRGEIMDTAIPDIREFSGFDAQIMEWVSALVDSSNRLVADPSSEMDWRGRLRHQF